IITIPVSRLGVIRAQQDWSIDIKIDENHLIEYNGLLFLAAGAVKNFGSPPEEENLFLNHFRVPKGLINLVDRKFKERKEDGSGIDFPEDFDTRDRIKLFISMRRRPMQRHALVLNEAVSKQSTDDSIGFLNEIENLSNF